MDRFERARAEGVDAREADMKRAELVESERRTILEKWANDLAALLDVAIPHDAASMEGAAEKHILQDAANWEAARLDYTRHGHIFLVQIQARAELEGRLLIGEGAHDLEPPLMRVIVTDKTKGQGTEYEYAYGLQPAGHLVSVDPVSFQYRLEQAIRRI